MGGSFVPLSVGQPERTAGLEAIAPSEDHAEAFRQAMEAIPARQALDATPLATPPMASVMTSRPLPAGPVVAFAYGKGSHLLRVLASFTMGDIPLLVRWERLNMAGWMLAVAARRS